MGPFSPRLPLAAIAAVVATMILHAFALSTASFATSFNGSAIVMSVTGLNPDFVDMGAPILIRHPGFTGSDCQYSIDGGALRNCDTVRSQVVIPFTRDTYTGNDVTLAILPGSSTTPLDIVVVPFTAQVGQAPSETLDFFPLTEFGGRTRAFAFNDAADVSSGGTATLMVGLFPKVIAPLTDSDKIKGASHVITLSLPPRFAATPPTSCTSRIDTLMNLEANYGSTYVASQVTAKRLSDGRTSYQWTPTYENASEEDWRVLSLVPLFVNCPGAAFSADPAEPDEYIEIFISYAETQAGLHQMHRVRYNTPSTMDHGNIVVPPARFQVIEAEALHVNYYTIASGATAVTDVDMAKLAVLFPSNTSVARVPAPAVLGVYIRYPLGADAGLKYFEDPMAGNKHGSTMSSTLLVNPQPMVEIVSAGVWSCRAAGSTGSFTECLSTPGCGVRTSLTDVVYCTNKARTAALSSGVPCSALAPPSVSTFVSYDDCGKWQCRNAAGVAGKCSEVHTKCPSGCTLTETDSVYLTGSEPFCVNSAGQEVTDEADIARYCPQEIIPKPAPAKCQPRSTCMYLCVNMTDYQPGVDGINTIVSCNDTQAFQSMCHVPGEASADWRVGLCADSTIWSVGMPYGINDIPYEITKLCNHLQVPKTTRDCLQCATGSWDTYVYYGSSGARAKLGDAVLDSVSDTDLYGSQSCHYHHDSGTVRKLANLKCACPSDTSKVADAIDNDAFATLCPDMPAAMDMYNQECVGYKLRWMCSPEALSPASSLVPCEDFDSSQAPSATNGGFATCSENKKCGAATVTRARRCVLYKEGETPITVGVSNECNELDYQPSVTAVCPMDYSECSLTVADGTCSHISPLDGKVSGDLQTYTCDNSLSGLSPRTYVKKALCTNVVDGTAGDMYACAGGVDGAYPGSAIVPFLYKPCSLPTCKLDEREWKWEVRNDATCFSMPGHKACKSFRRSTLICMTRETGISAHSAWEEVSVKYCADAQTPVPSGFSETIACTGPGAPSESTCEAHIQECTDYPLIINKNGSLTGGIYSECMCKDGNYGANCEIALQVTAAHISTMPAQAPFESFSVEIEFQNPAVRDFINTPGLAVLEKKQADGSWLASTATSDGFFLNDEATHVPARPERTQVQVFTTAILRAGEYRVNVDFGNGVSSSTESVTVPAACQDLCLNDGTCNLDTEKCDCTSGFAGEFCGTDICHDAGCSAPEQECSVNAENQVTCSCRGDFTGDDGACEYNEVYCSGDGGRPACAPGGLRKASYDTDQVTIVCGDCECSGNWSGDTCDTCTLTCENGAPTNTDCTGCTCPSRYTGDRCEIDLCADAGCPEFVSECIIDDIDDNKEPKCECKGDFNGEACQYNEVYCSGVGAQPACANGGMRLATEDAEGNITCGTCECSGNWTGATCSDCGLCGNGSIPNTECTACECPEGFGGELCDIDLCAEANCTGATQDCQIGDNDSTQCDCKTGFTGDSCEYNDAHCGADGAGGLEACKNGSRRKASFEPDGVTIKCSDCECTGSWTGDTCADCGITCENGGTITEDSCTRCTCAAGFTGDTCATDLCADANCDAAREKCVVSDDNTSATCVCKGTFTGNACQYNDEYCSGAGGRGACENGSHRLASPGAEDTVTCGACECTEQWDGDTCALCGLVCSNGGTADSVRCRSCSCSDGIGGPTCGLRAYFIQFLVDVQHESLRSWFPSSNTPVGNLIAVTAFREWLTKLENAFMTFLDARAVSYVAKTLAFSGTGVHINFVNATRGVGSQSRFLSLRFTLSHSGSLAEPPAASASVLSGSLAELSAATRVYLTKGVFTALDTAALDGALADLKTAFANGALTGDSSFAAVNTGAGLGVSDPLCTGDSCPQGVGDGGAVPAETPDDSSSSGLTDGELAAVIVCSVVGGVLLLTLLIVCLTGNCCCCPRDKSSATSPSTTPGDLELQRAGKTAADHDTV